MNNKPQIPPPVLEIPWRKVWVTLLAPPLVTFLANLAVLLAWEYGYRDTGINPIVALVIFFIIIRQMFRLKRIVQPRFPGISWVLLRWSYLLGQIFVCMALYASACALDYQHHTP